MNFEHVGLAFDLLDTPDDHDFSLSGISARTLTGSGSALINHSLAMIACYFRAHRHPRAGRRFALEGVGDT
jgi:hypothetical protein